MATVTPPTPTAEPRKALPAPSKAVPAKKVASTLTTKVTPPPAKKVAATKPKASASTTKVTPPAVKAPARTAVKGAKTVEGVEYFQGQGNPPCFGKSHDPKAPECSEETQACLLRTPCSTKTEAASKPGEILIQQSAHPKKDLIKKDGEDGYAAGFLRIKEILNTARAEAERVLERPTLQIAEIASALYKNLTRETFEAAGQKYLNIGYRHLMRFVRVQEKFGHLPSAEALQLVENCGSQENLFEVCKADDPIALARKGEVTFMDTSGKKVTKKLAELSKREIPVALKAAPGVKSANAPRKTGRDVAASESKAKPMPVVRRIGKPLHDNLATLKEVAKKAKHGEIGVDDLQELKPLPAQLRAAADAVELLISKAGKAPKKADKAAPTEAVLED